MISLPISLPTGFNPNIQEGDQVIVGQVIAIKEITDEEVINIPRVLAISRSKVKDVVKKNPGERVEKGEVIALKKSLFGTKSIVLRSRVAGTVVRYERNSGNLVIKSDLLPASDIKNLISPVEGQVILCNNNEILINTDKHVVIGTKSVGGKGEGEIIQLEKDDTYYLDARSIGKIVIGESFTREMLLKGIGIGVAGMVGTGIKDEDIEHILDKNFQTPILEVSQENLGKLIEWKTKKVYLDALSKSIIFLHL